MRRRDFITLLGGTAATWPLAAEAQQASKTPTIGVLWHAGSEEEEGVYPAALRQGLKDFGYIEGQNIKLEERFPGEIPERFYSLAAELVALKVIFLFQSTVLMLWLRNTRHRLFRSFLSTYLILSEASWSQAWRIREETLPDCPTSQPI